MRARPPLSPSSPRPSARRERRPHSVAHALTRALDSAATGALSAASTASIETKVSHVRTLPPSPWTIVTGTWFAWPCARVTLPGANLSRARPTEVSVHTVSPSRTSCRMVT